MPSAAPIRQDRIPSIGELYNRLGYGHLSDLPLRDLSRTTHAWRQLYTGGDITIIRWSRYETQKRLSLLAETFLDTSPHGNKFWPATGQPYPHPVPEYPEDRDSILQLLKQLFWRQCVKAVQNASYNTRHRLKVHDWLSENSFMDVRDCLKLSSLQLRPSTTETDVEDQFLPTDMLVARQLQAELERSALPEVGIHFYVFTSEAFQMGKWYWKEASLGALVEDTLENFFGKISQMLSTPIRYIKFKLHTPYTETVFGIDHEYDAYFRTMKQIFIKEIEESLRQTGSPARFEIWLHPCSSPWTCG